MIQIKTISATEEEMGDCNKIHCSNNIHPKYYLQPT